jgi:hypothetical protein
MLPVYQLSNKPVNSIHNNNIRGVTMKLQNILLVAVALMIPGTVWAYGDNSAAGSGTGVCKQVNFSEFAPINNSEVAPESEFSFYASPATYPKSIRVTVKGQSVPVTVLEKQAGFKVFGRLPDSVRGTFAKIHIDARGVNQCEVSDGWLVKVTQ